MRGDELVWQGNPSFKGMLPWYVKYLAICALLNLIAYGLNRIDILPVFFLVLFFLASFGGVFGFGHLTRKTTIYTITRARVSEKRGVINTVKEQATIEKITNITVRRSLSERLLGIGRLNIDTASDAISEDILQWWGIKDPYGVESMIDALRMEVEEERERAGRSTPPPLDD